MGKLVQAIVDLVYPRREGEEPVAMWKAVVVLVFLGLVLVLGVLSRR